jgi:hypothetical protein
MRAWRNGDTRTNSAIVFRFVDINNYWWFGQNSSTPDPWTWALFRIVAGSQVAVDGPDDGITGGSSSVLLHADMIVTLSGSSIICEMPDEGVSLSTTDTAHQSATKHGLRFTKISVTTNNPACSDILIEQN